MVLTLRTMKAEEFPAYRDYFIHDYALEIAANFGHTPQKSLAIAQQEFLADLPQNVSTPNHVLLCLETSDDLVGYLWYRCLPDGESVFILDFVVFEKFRGRGYGTAAVTALEEHLSQVGIKNIKLRVAYENKRALALYEKLGFAITGYTIAKQLKK
jgi:ribosomal protein S18 acetylase RimI-like enzyme